MFPTIFLSCVPSSLNHFRRYSRDGSVKGCIRFPVDFFIVKKHDEKVIPGWKFIAKRCWNFWVFVNNFPIWKKSWIQFQFCFFNFLQNCYGDFFRDFSYGSIPAQFLGYDISVLNKVKIEKQAYCIFGIRVMEYSARRPQYRVLILFGEL